MVWYSSRTGNRRCQCRYPLSGPDFARRLDLKIQAQRLADVIGSLECNARAVVQLFAKQIDRKRFWFDSSAFRQFWVVATYGGQAVLKTVLLQRCGKGSIPSLPAK